MIVRVVVEVEVKHVRGKFVGREEITEVVLDELERADPSYLSGMGSDGDSEYDIEAWAVSEEMS